MPLPPSPSLPLGFQVFPPDNIWNTPVDKAPLHPNNAVWMDPINGFTNFPLHPNFGPSFGFTYGLTGKTVPLVPVAFRTDVSYAAESDPLPPAGLPIPVGSLVDSGEGHLHLIDTDNLVLHEFYGAIPQTNGSWFVTQYSRWDLTSNALRPDGWTSTNAAGLPMFAGLVRWDEIQTGKITHAIGFTVTKTWKPHIWPARHDALSGVANNYPQGLRVRLKASVDISTFSPTNQIILTAMKKYGMIMHDTSGNWFVSGAMHPNFVDADLSNLKALIPQNAFEVVDTSSWMVSLNSGQVIPSVAVIPPPPLPGVSTLADYEKYKANLNLLNQMKRAIGQGAKTATDADYVALQALIKSTFRPEFLDLF